MRRKLDRTLAWKEIIQKERNGGDVTDEEIKRFERLTGIRRLSEETTKDALSRIKEIVKNQQRYEA